ncbi:MAG TPA: hypothetical protein VK875_03665 [Euzebyales bacterium]|nr:hypothetical protein [Euzebyales bacterium]
MADDVRDRSAIRVRRARSFDLNEAAELWTDCGLVPSLDDLGAADALLLVLDDNPDAERFWAAADFDHAADVHAYRRRR